jgi:hypothetical protein
MLTPQIKQKNCTSIPYNKYTGSKTKDFLLMALSCCSSLIAGLRCRPKEEDWLQNPLGCSRRGSGGLRPWVSGRDPRLGQTRLSLATGWPARGRSGSDETEKEGTMRERRTVTE